MSFLDDVNQRNHEAYGGDSFDAALPQAGGGGASIPLPYQAATESAGGGASATNPPPPPTQSVPLPPATFDVDLDQIEQSIDMYREQYHVFKINHTDLKFPNLPTSAGVDKCRDVLIQCRAMIARKRGVKLEGWIVSGLMNGADYVMPNIKHDLEPDREVFEEAVQGYIYSNPTFTALASNTNSAAICLIATSFVSRFFKNRKLRAAGIDPREVDPDMSDGDLDQFIARHLMAEENKQRDEELMAAAMMRRLDNERIEASSGVVEIPEVEEEAPNEEHWVSSAFAEEEPIHSMPVVKKRKRKYVRKAPLKKQKVVAE